MLKGGECVDVNGKGGMSALVHVHPLFSLSTRHFDHARAAGRDGAHPSHIILLVPFARQKHAAKQPCSGGRGALSLAFLRMEQDRGDTRRDKWNGEGYLGKREVWLALTSERPIMLIREACVQFTAMGRPGMRPINGCPLPHPVPC